MEVSLLACSPSWLGACPALWLLGLIQLPGVTASVSEHSACTQWTAMHHTSQLAVFRSPLWQCMCGRSEAKQAWPALARRARLRSMAAAQSHQRLHHD